MFARIGRFAQKKKFTLPTADKKPEKRVLICMPTLFIVPRINCSTMAIKFAEG